MELASGKNIDKKIKISESLTKISNAVIDCVLEFEGGDFNRNQTLCSDIDWIFHAAPIFFNFFRIRPC